MVVPVCLTGTSAVARGREDMSLPMYSDESRSGRGAMVQQLKATIGQIVTSSSRGAVGPLCLRPCFVYCLFWSKGTWVSKSPKDYCDFKRTLFETDH